MKAKDLKFGDKVVVTKRGRKYTDYVANVVLGGRGRLWVFFETHGNMRVEPDYEFEVVPRVRAI
ncbi:hypothetical protein LU447_004297 [Salmonella enterica]|nr:hypothetical protein [Salmonella enterica]